MTPERARELTLKLDAKMTEYEVESGCHYCLEWDELVVWPGMPEWGDDLDRCRCGYTKVRGNR